MLEPHVGIEAETQYRIERQLSPPPAPQRPRPPPPARAGPPVPSARRRLDD